VASIRISSLLLIGGIFCADAGCGSKSPSAPADTDVCTGYSDPTSSQYVLPYPVGSTYRIIQGNCSAPGNGHRGSDRYAYDFDMTIGATIAAIQSGVAIHVEASHFDGQIAPTGLDNYVVVRHNDGSYALYGHLTHEGAMVAAGDSVARGQAIARSGNTGNTNNTPHLHVDIHLCDPVTGGTLGCPTVPLTFRNAQPNPGRLQLNERYLAVAY
jgi:murein DD-endopeptidase MepM/ murein hydrolase activator NlpD